MMTEAEWLAAMTQNQCLNCRMGERLSESCFYSSCACQSRIFNLRPDEETGRNFVMAVESRLDDLTDRANFHDRVRESRPLAFDDSCP